MKVKEGLVGEVAGSLGGEETSWLFSIGASTFVRFLFDVS